MTDEQIMQALICLKNPEFRCSNCIYNSRGLRCHELVMADAFDLINSQKVKIKKIKSEAIKEFAERLKATITINNTNDGYLDYAIDYGCLVEDIDELVKEMTGGKDNA